MPLQSLLNASRILLRGISQVFLQGDPRLGLACLLAIAVGAPPLLAGALLGLSLIHISEPTRLRCTSY
ncbi:urea transporter, partial [Pseudomonas aeruginosa]